MQEAELEPPRINSYFLTLRWGKQKFGESLGKSYFYSREIFHLLHLLLPRVRRTLTLQLAIAMHEQPATSDEIIK